MRKMRWMNWPAWSVPLLILALLAALAPRPAAAAEPTLADLEKTFRELPIEARHHTGPLFWLHGDESKDQLLTELQKVLEGGNGTFTAESRPHTDWLGEGWYRDLAILLDFARANKMTMWIFDEKWWPSGEVAGNVPPQFGSKRLEGAATDVEGAKHFEAAGFGTNLVAVIAGKKTEGGIDGASLVDLTAKVQGDRLIWDAPAGAWQVLKFTWTPAPPRRKNILLDGASRDAVDWYVKTVYQPHYDRFAADFGKTIQGYFYDEPETVGDWGTEVIPMLKSRGVDWKKALVAWKFALAGEEQAAAKYQYQDAKAEAWGKTFYGALSQWCEAHGVTSMGHWLEHNYLYHSQEMCAGNMFQMMKYSGMGALDLVFKQLPPGTRPYSDYQMTKIASSISHVYGKKDDVTMVEIFGARGQDLPYNEMKWQTDKMHVEGVNFLIPHSFNPRGPFDRDCPPYFYNGGYEPRYPLYRVFADYTSRLSGMLTGGRHVAPVAQLYMGNSVHVGKVIKPELLTSALQDALYDCDWLPYDVFENDSKLEAKEVALYGERYKALIVPPVEVIPCATLEKTKAFFDRGGVVVGYGFLPTKSATLGKSSQEIAALVTAIWGADPKPGLKAVKTNDAGGRAYFLGENPTPEELQQALAGDAGLHPTLEVAEGQTGNWLHVLHRVKAGRDVFFVTNQNLDGGARKFKFRVTAQGEPECWDALHNEITAVRYQRLSDNQVEIPLTLEPYESVLLVFNAEKRALPPRLEADAKPVREFAIARDLSIKDPGLPEPTPKATPAPTPTPVAVTKKGKKAGTMSLAGCAWVWYPEPNARGVEAPAGERYFRGTIELPQGAKVRQARFMVTCDNGFDLKINAQAIGKSDPGGESWRTPRTLDIAKALQPGRNVVAIAAVNGTDKPSPAGLIGRYEIALEDGAKVAGTIDKTWKATDKKAEGWDAAAFDDQGWKAPREVAKFGDAPWNRVGGRGAAAPRPMLTLSPVKADTFNGIVTLPADLDLKRGRIFVVCDEIAPEAAARVTVNGQDAGGFIEKPLRVEVSRLLKAGANTIRIAPFAPKNAKLAVYAE